jgi:two-component system copper resistance phosphate regulon response regulator CusR
MKLLIVEDERKTTAYLTKGLVENGFVVDSCSDGISGLHLAETEDYNLVILDVMLPERDGWDVLSRLRESGKATPVLFLTARDSVDDRVKGLELGADDYLVKPFAFSELLARVRALLRRPQRRAPDIMTVADLRIDIRRHRATRGDQVIELTPKEFSLVSLLAERSGEVVSRTLIAERVWDMNFDSDTNVVDVHIRRLRAKLDDPFERKLVHTVRGLGYVLR